MNPLLELVGLSLALRQCRIRDVRLHGISPAEDILRSELLPGRQASKILRTSTSPGYNLLSSVIKEAHSRSLSTRKRVPSPITHCTEKVPSLAEKFHDCYSSRLLEQGASWEKTL